MVIHNLSLICVVFGQLTKRSPAGTGLQPPSVVRLNSELFVCFRSCPTFQRVQRGGSSAIHPGNSRRTWPLGGDEFTGWNGSTQVSLG